MNEVQLYEEPQSPYLTSEQKTKIAIATIGSCTLIAVTCILVRNDFTANIKFKNDNSTFKFVISKASYPNVV